MAQLPEELVLDILSRLPVKSILRFRCVCKSWYSLFRSPDFIAIHLQRSRKRHFYLLQAIESLPDPDNTELIAEYPCPIYQLIEDPDHSKSYQRHIFALVPDDKLDQAIVVETPNPQISHIIPTFNGRKYLDVDVAGCIDGLVCLSFNCSTCIVIWNPSTSQFHQVPNPKISRKGFHECSYGFAEHNGHKVVRLVSKTESSRYFLASSVRAEMFDIRTNSWNEIIDPPQVLFSNHTCGTIVKGVPYWPMDYDVYASEVSEWIISFSAGHNTFSMIKRPDFEIGEKEFTWRLGTMRDSLVTFVQKSNFSMDVWMKMDDHVGENVSWTKQFTVDQVLGIETWVACWKDGEFLVSNAHEYAFEKEIFLYDVQSEEAKTFPEIRPEEEERSPIEVSLYTESLISPFYSY